MRSRVARTPCATRTTSSCTLVYRDLCIVDTHKRDNTAFTKKSNVTINGSVRLRNRSNFGTIFRKNNNHSLVLACVRVNKSIIIASSRRGVADIADPLELYLVSCIYISIYNIYLYRNIHLKWIYSSARVFLVYVCTCMSV